MRIMGLDVGDKTIGVALSDPLGWTAQGLEVIRRENVEKDIGRLSEIAQEYGVEKILVGIPKNMNATIGPQGEKVLAFIEQLKARIDLPIKTWDERLSTVAAERMLIQADVSRSKRKKVIDKMAAAVILQGYLDAGAR
ncbi:Holliday junction resolvase [Desulforamulus profundi]|uniref:Putative pre-16S rRNA nuclease n=1 Tax=Desulforamulus profundi TaxID=1383067 RepID=A0A2C6MH95_9FIRM|nr:Holliday junction resolvase RuvX [Desulforamulus profundi]MCL5781197.1 Holliday junction resolvase RuvX [Bacillota bacterium]PHJ39132.1 Holliday junction resolvase [Desulforamulus profundi]